MPLENLELTLQADDRLDPSPQPQMHVDCDPDPEVIRPCYHTPPGTPIPLWLAERSLRSFNSSEYARSVFSEVTTLKKFSMMVLGPRDDTRHLQTRRGDIGEIEIVQNETL